MKVIRKHYYPGQVLGNHGMVYLRDSSWIGKQRKGLFLCHCGMEFSTDISKIKNGHTKSCGCSKNEMISNSKITHGMSHSPEHNTWLAIKKRCYTPHDPAYRYYGGRGIGVCERWLNSYENFYSDMGPRPSSVHSIERLELDDDYHPHNCVWATQIEQANNKSNNRIIEYLGESMTTAQWARKLNLTYKSLEHRLNRGWDIERAFTQPMRTRATI